MKSYIFSPLGYILLESGEYGLTRIKFLQDKKPTYKKEVSPLLLQAEKELIEYFDKKRTTFDIPLQLIGTAFQLEVWKKALQIPYGKTISYSELAKAIGKPFAYRAVGNALGKNPLPIIVPCHRVLSKNGLGGFSAPFYIKEFLLDLERG